jgi:RNA polymerase-binding transcription factor DksA
LVSVTQQTEAEAQALLSEAKQAVDAVIERTLDHVHETMVRKGAPEDTIDEAMRNLYRQVHEARTRTLIRMADITAKRVENGNAELH